jgi:glycosyltransferase involved in cell wall biosynthesis
VDAYLVLSESAKAIFLRGGLSPRALIVKPNFVDPDPGVGPHDGGYAVFAGRLSPEKGIEFLLELWQCLGRDVPLRIYGDGPLVGLVRKAASEIAGVTYGGVVSQSELAEAMGSAKVLVIPSLATGDVPTTLLLGLAVGLPVVVARSDSLREVVPEGTFGHTAPVGDRDAWQDAVKGVLSDQRWRCLSNGARNEYLNRYSRDVAYGGLMAAYDQARGAVAARAAGRLK